MVEDTVKGYFFLIAEHYIDAARDEATEKDTYAKIQPRIPESEKRTFRRILNPVVRYLQDSGVVVRDSRSGYNGKRTVTIREGEDINTTLENLFDGFTTQGEKLTLPPSELKPINGQTQPTLAEMCQSIIEYERARLSQDYHAAAE